MGSTADCQGVVLKTAQIDAMAALFQFFSAVNDGGLSTLDLMEIFKKSVERESWDMCQINLSIALHAFELLQKGG